MLSIGPNSTLNTMAEGSVGDGVQATVAAPHQTLADLPLLADSALSSATLQEAKLTASDGQTGDYLGWSVSISGNTVVVGAWGAMVGGNFDQGAAYVFTESSSGWASMTEIAKLTASDGQAFDHFGSVGFDQRQHGRGRSVRSHGRCQRRPGGSLRLQ